MADRLILGNAPRWHVDVGFLTDPGLVRERNEDSFAIHLPYAGEASRAPADALFAVADGMGGHEAGDVASQYVAGAAQRAFAERDGDITDIGAWLERLIRRVNRELASMAKRQSAFRGMGSTLTIGVLQLGHLYLGHVGDSRCYRLYGGELEQLTPDHSWVGAQLRAGRLTPEEAATHPKRNLLTQCLGVDREVRPYLAEEPLRDGARYLLCSDGLFGDVPKEVIRRVLVDERVPQAASARLVAIANEAGGGDNITAVVFDVLLTSELSATMPGIHAMPATPESDLRASPLTGPPGVRPGDDLAQTGREPTQRTVTRKRLSRLLLAAGSALVLTGTAVGARHLLTSSTEAGPTEQVGEPEAAEAVEGSTTSPGDSATTNPPQNSTP